MSKRLLLAFFLSFGLSVSARSDDSGRQYIDDLANSRVRVSPQNFSVCSQYGCKHRDVISMEQNQWQQLFVSLHLPTNSAAMERAEIAEFIAHMEIRIGRLTQTQYDRGGTYAMYLDFFHVSSNQMDCIDESANVFTYLKMLDSDDRLRWHEIEGLVTRGGLRAGYPHTAVMIRDRTTRREYVVDSWFLDNGRPAAIVPYDEWKAGWKPDF